MPRPAPRIHRLPHRLDYTLIPAPLDLSLPLAAEKSPLPAIIVTPSSPSSAHDFSIAFMAPAPKPTIRERLPSYTSFKSSVHFRARTAIIVFFIIFILVCHLVTHRLLARRPHLEFSSQGGDARLVEESWNWLNFRSLWSTGVPNVIDDFIVVEPMAPEVIQRGLP